MDLKDSSILISTVGGKISKLTKTKENRNQIDLFFQEKKEVVALRVTDSGHLFYITSDKVLKFLKHGTKISKEILTDVKVRQNGKNLRVYDDLLII